jgi:hypothetical protein
MNPDRYYVEDELTDITFARLVDFEKIPDLLEAHYKISAIGGV